MDGMRFALYLLVMSATTYLIRALPFVIFRKKIQNQFILSVLYYAPYAVLSAMTFPGILYATGSFLSAGIGLGASFLAAWKNAPMILVAIIGSGAAIAAELLMMAGG